MADKVASFKGIRKRLRGVPYSSGEREREETKAQRLEPTSSDWKLRTGDGNRPKTSNTKRVDSFVL